MSAKLPAELAKIAYSQIGVEEVDGSNCGPQVNEYKAATSLDPNQPWPWCAAFVCWVVREAAKKAGVKFTETFRRPTTAGAWAFELWSLAQDKSTSTKKPSRSDIMPGDIVIYHFSHIGIALTAPDKNGYVTCVEGNTDGQGSREGGAVLRKQRHVSKIRSRIRFTV